MKIEALEALARDMVGDGKFPDVFFVSCEPHGLLMITPDFFAAYQFWRQLPRNVETALENRTFGCICTTEPQEDGSTILVTYDDSESFRECEAEREKLLCSNQIGLA